MKIKEIVSKLEKIDSDKSRAILRLCEEYLPFEEMIILDQDIISFPTRESGISAKEILTDAFLSRLGMLEFGYNGWVFAGGGHKAITQNTEVLAQRFGELYGKHFGAKIPLATGATTKFMEAVNSGYNKSGHNSITSTTTFPIVGNKVNKEVKYCFTSSTFSNMESFLVNNSIGGVFFEGGFGTIYEASSMLIEVKRGVMNRNTPLIFVRRDMEDNILYTISKTMEIEGKIYSSDMDHIYSVETAEEALSILSGYDSFKIALEKNDVIHDFVREIFIVSKNRYL